MKETRIHGRGGQGGVTAAEMTAAAFAHDGKYAQSIPTFGVERRGAPTSAGMRFDDSPVRERTLVRFPECLIVLDASQLASPEVFVGLKAGGILVLNSTAILQESPHSNLALVGVVDATRIALEEIGRAIPNTTMMGAFAGTTGWVTLEAITWALGNYFEGESLRKNIRCAERGFREVQTKRW